MRAAFVAAGAGPGAAAAVQAHIHDRLAAHGVEEHPFFVGDGYSKLFKMPAGTVIGQHAHSIAHDSVLLVGRVILRGPNGSQELVAPAVAHLPAFAEHSVEALTPVLWACNWPNAEGLTDADELERGVIAP